MSDLKNIVAATVNGEDFSLYDILHSMSINNNLGFVHNEIVNILIKQAIKREGVEVSDEELQKAADSFRQKMGLQKVSDTNAWLKKTK